MACKFGTLDSGVMRHLRRGTAMYGMVVGFLIVAACGGHRGDTLSTNLNRDRKGVATGGPSESGTVGARPSASPPKNQMPRFTPSARRYNAGVVLACNRFLALAAGEGDSTPGLLGTPFLHDGRKLLQTFAETDAFATELNARAKKGGVVLSLLELKCCPGNVDKSALLEWFGVGISSERAEALRQHTQKMSGAWFCVMTVGRSTTDVVKTEEIFVGVAPTGSDGGWQVVGFMD